MGIMETQRAGLSLGRWSLWLLLLGLVLPSASAQALSYRQAVLHAVDQPTEKSSEANLYRLLEPSPPSLGHTVPPFAQAVPTVRKALCPLGGLPPLPGNLPRPGSPASPRLPALASLLWEQAPCTPGSQDFRELQGWRGSQAL